MPKRHLEAEGSSERAREGARLGSGSGLSLGLGRAQMAPTQQGAAMMGWAMLHNVARKARTPLHARAFIVDDGQRRIAFVVCEILSVSHSIRQALVARLAHEAPQLELADADLCLMATHTHSGPGGYDHYPLYNLTIPGFVQSTLDAIVDMIFRALVAAHEDLSPGKLRYAALPFTLDVPVAFNRQPAAHASNPEVDDSLADNPQRALDRQARQLHFEDEYGELRGLINWFAVHGTSVHSDNDALHFDNKGYAAKMSEHRLGEGVIAAFAQAAAGDVTPNAYRHAGRPWVRGESIDDDESARINGGYQCRQAQRVLDAAKAEMPLTSRVQREFAYVDFSKVRVDPRYTGGLKDVQTGPGELGLAMIFGTDEGPGIPRSLLFSQRLGQGFMRVKRKLLPKTQARKQQILSQAPKLSVMQVGQRKLLGVSRLRALPLPFGKHPAVDQLIELDQNSLESPLPWTPQILPIQLIRLGELAIIAVPAEFTTAAGRRLRASVARRLDITVEQVVLAGYANAYSGYVTTPEEYDAQNYEGASTHFGRWTLGAYQSSFDRLIDGSLDPRLSAPEFGEQDLAGRHFRAPEGLHDALCELDATNA